MESNECRVCLVESDSSGRTALEFLLANAGFVVEQGLSLEQLLESPAECLCECVVFNCDSLRRHGLAWPELAVLNQQYSLVFYSLGSNLLTSLIQVQRNSIRKISPPIDSEKLLETIDALVRCASEEVHDDRHRQDARERLSRLTHSEFEILQHLVEGRSSCEIAAERGTSRSTVQNQRARIQEKMQARNIADLVRLYLLATNSGPVL